MSARISKSRRVTISLLAVATALLTATSLPASEEARRAAEEDRLSFVGCYLTELGAWWPPTPTLSPAASDVIGLLPPEWFDLQDQCGYVGLESNGFRVRPLILSNAVAPFMSYWRPISAKTVVIVWTSGFWGLRIEAARVGTVLHGTAYPLSDADFSGQSLDVILKPVSCGDVHRQR